MLNSFYYKIRPFIPRHCQIAFRRIWIRYRRRNFAHVWPIDENVSGPPEGWNGWPGGKRFALVLTHDVDTARGQDRCRRLMNLDRALGFRASFNFVAEKYTNHAGLFNAIREGGCEIGLHGLRHHNNMFRTYASFMAQVPRINKYLTDWDAVGFRAPCMYHNLEWSHKLNIEYDASTFDTDPFEPQPDGVGTIFPFWVAGKGENGGYVELPYTLPQDFTLFILLQEKDIEIWKRKLDWIVARGGMALLVTHPDYMGFDGEKCGFEEYPADYYAELLSYIKNRYGDQYWNPVPQEIARYWRDNMVERSSDQQVMLNRGAGS